ncbi:MAG: GNAT family N-acetyltransferase [Chloroflexota bacterium]
MQELAIPSGGRLRPGGAADLAAIVALRNLGLHPVRQWTVEHRREWERSTRSSENLTVVVEWEGDIVAFAELDPGGAFRRPDGGLYATVRVVPRMRGRGIGATLHDMIEAEARSRGAPRLLSVTSETEVDGLRWATQRGWREAGRQLDSYRDLTEPFPGCSPAPVALVSVAALFRPASEKRALELYELYRECHADIPGAPEALDQEGFRALMLEGPLVALDLSFAALAGERVVGMTMTMRRGPSTAYTSFTGTARDHRRRGVARSLKLFAFAEAARKGVRSLLCSNDETNGGMRRINERLGYRPLPALIRLEKVLVPTSAA